MCVFSVERGVSKKQFGGEETKSWVRLRTATFSESELGQSQPVEVPPAQAGQVLGLWLLSHLQYSGLLPRDSQQKCAQKFRGHWLCVHRP